MPLKKTRRWNGREYVDALRGRSQGTVWNEALGRFLPVDPQYMDRAAPVSGGRNNWGSYNGERTGSGVDILKTFLNELKQSSVAMPYPHQQEAADWLASAYGSGNASLGMEVPESLSTLLSQYGPASTLKDVQNLLLSSHWGTVGEFAQNILQGVSSRQTIGDAFSDATVAMLQAFPNYQSGRGSITNFVVNTIRNALTRSARSANKASAMSGGLMTEDPVGDVYSDPWSGAVAPGQAAPTLPGEPETWMETLLKATGGGVRIPTSLSSPGGEFLMNGRLNPWMGVPFHSGEQQVFVGEEELGQWAAQVFGGAGYQDERFNKLIETSLRRVASGLRGNDTVGGNVLGDNMQELDAVFSAGEREAVAKVPSGRLLYSRTMEAFPNSYKALPDWLQEDPYRGMSAYKPEFPGYGHEIYDAAADPTSTLSSEAALQSLNGLAWSPGQKLAVRMANEVRTLGHVGRGFVRRNRSPELTAENAAANRQLDQMNPWDLAQFQLDNYGAPSDIPPEAQALYMRAAQRQIDESQHQWELAHSEERVSDNGNAVVGGRVSIAEPDFSDMPMPEEDQAIEQSLPSGVSPRFPRKVKLVLGPTGRFQQNGAYIPMYFNRKANTVFMDTDGMVRQFRSKAWTRSASEGVEPLPEDAFSSPEEYMQAGLDHEAAHVAGVRDDNEANRFMLRKRDEDRAKRLENADIDTLPFGTRDAATNRQINALMTEGWTRQEIEGMSPERADRVLNLHRAGLHKGEIEHLAPEQEDQVLRNWTAHRPVDPNSADFDTQAPDGEANPFDVDDFGAPGRRYGPQSVRLTAANVANLQARAGRIGMNNLARVGSPHVGWFRSTNEQGVVEGRTGDTLGGHFVRNGVETLNSTQTAMAANWAQGAAAQAAGADLEGLDPESAHMTFAARMRDAIKNYMASFVKAAGEAGEDKAVATDVAKKIGEVANAIVQPLAKSLTGGSNLASFSANATNIGQDAELLRQHMSANAELRDKINDLGGVDEAVNGPHRILLAGGNAYNMGQNSWEEYGENSRYGRNPDGSPRNPYGRSPRQTDFGRAMTAVWMSEMAWRMTGGSLVTEAGKYATEQYSMLPLYAYGGGDIGGAASFASAQGLATERSQRLAYEQFGSLLGMGQGYAGSGLNQIGNAALMGVGAGALAFGGTWIAGMAGLTGATTGASGAMPIALGAAADVGLPLLAMAGYNAVTGKTPYEGLSLGNLTRGTHLSQAIQKQYGLFSSEYWSSFPGLFQGSDENSVMDRLFPGMSYADILRSGMSPQELASNPNLPSEEAGPTLQQRNLQKYAEETAAKFSLTPEDAQKRLANLQPMLGGLTTTDQKDAAWKLIQTGQATGTDYSGALSSLISGRGMAPGGEEALGLVQQFNGLTTSQERTGFLLQQQHDMQALSQFAPYVQGTSATAAGLYSKLDMNMPQAQAAAAMIAGAARAYQRELTPMEAENLAMQTQSLGQWATPVAGWAGQMSQLGVSDYSLAVSSFGTAIAGGMDPNILGDLMSFNRYAWSDLARSQGMGRFQTMQANGLAMGTTEIGGLVQFAREQLGYGGASRQVLSALGMTDAAYQDAALSGGTWGIQDLYRDNTRNLQWQQFGLQERQLANNAAYRAATWDINQQQSGIQWQSQQFGFAQAQRQMDLSNQFWLENWQAAQRQSGVQNNFQNWAQAFDYQTSLMQRDWSRQNFNYSQQMSTLQYGWNLEDINEQIRRSSGYERAQLIKQRGRMTTTFGLSSERAEEQQEHQEELWKREDERFARQQQYARTVQELDAEAFERQKRQHDAMAKLEQENFDERKRTAEDLHKLQVELQQLQHQHDLDGLAFSRESLEIQKQQMIEQQKYQDSMQVIARLQSQLTADFQKMASSSSGAREMLGLLLQIVQAANGASLTLHTGQGSLKVMQ